MTATAHALIGTIIAAKIGNPALAIPLALTSHILADLVPHWDTAIGVKLNGKSLKRVFTDTLIDISLGFILSYFLISLFFPQTNLIYVFFIIIIAQLPDWFMAPYYFFKIKFFKFGYDFGKNTNIDLDKPWGIVTQVTVVILLLILAKVF